MGFLANLAKFIPVIVVEIGRKIAEGVGDFIKGLGKSNPITKDSNADDIADINSIFTEFKMSIHDKIMQIEDEIQKEVAEYADQLIFLIENNKGTFSKYNINLRRFNRNAGKLKSKLNGILSNAISRTISLDNPECNRIIKMLPGNQKEEALDIFLKSAIDSGINVLVNEMKSITNEIAEDFEDTLYDCIAVVEKENTAKLDLLNEAESKSANEEEAKEILYCNANFIISICDITENILKEE